MLLFLIITPVSAQTSGNTTIYSLVHISDTQYLASHYPGTYAYTFSYLDSIKEQYNISAIIISGDLVDTWNNEKQWDTYFQAVQKTSIPVFVIGGNHDTNGGRNYEYYARYTGNLNPRYVASIGDMDLVGISYAESGSLEPGAFAELRKSLLNSPGNFTIIATHYYMDENGTLSRMGNDINRQLIVKPTLVLSGHKHTLLIRDRMIGPYPIIEDLTNYQDGIPGGSSSENVSAGTFYTITLSKGQLDKISAKIIWISPRQSFGSEHVLYDASVPEPDEEPPLSEITPDCNTIPGICNVPSTSRPGDIWNSLREFLQGLFRLS